MSQHQNAEKTERARIEKKLKPFREIDDRLKGEIAVLQAEYDKEVLLNDVNVALLNKVEKDLDEKTKSIDKIMKQLQNQSSGTDAQVVDKNQKLDAKLEEQVKRQLDEFLLKQSKIHEIQFDEDGNEREYYTLKIKEGRNISIIQFQKNVKTFQDLRNAVAKYKGVEPKQVFFTDYLGNIFQFQMEVLPSLYPPVYELLRNYDPVVCCEIRWPKKKQTQIVMMKEHHLTDEVPYAKTFRAEDKQVKVINWQLYLKIASGIKYVFESILFLSMLIFFILVQLDASEFIQNNQLVNSIMTQINIGFNLQYPPELEVLKAINLTIPTEMEKSYDNTLFPTVPLMNALLVQQSVNGQDLDSCIFTDEIVRNYYKDSKKTCLDYNELYTGDLTDAVGYSNHTSSNPTQWNSTYGGYVWELNMTNQDSLTSQVEYIKEWLDYGRYEVYFHINYYNAPQNTLIQTIIHIHHLYTQDYMNYVTQSYAVYQLSDYNSFQSLLNDLMQYIAIVLLVFSAFDFFQPVFKQQFNPLINLYNECKKEETRIANLKARNAEISEIDLDDLKKKQTIINEFWIIDLKFLFLVIKKPLIFDMIYIISFFMILLKSKLYDYYYGPLSQIKIDSTEFQDLIDISSRQLIFKIYLAINIFFLMMSIIRFLGNWSEILKCYGVVMVRFNKQSWFIILVLVYVLSFIALAQLITVQASMNHHTGFIFVFLGIMRSTLKNSLYTDVALEGLPTTVTNNITYSFFVRYLQYVAIIVIVLVMTPIFISLMTQEVHNTKQEVKLKLLQNQKK